MANDNTVNSKVVDIIGMGGHAAVVSDILELNNFLIAGYYADKEPDRDHPRIKAWRGDIQYLKLNTMSFNFKSKTQLWICAIGNNEVRRRIVNFVAQGWGKTIYPPHFKWITAIHPRSIISKSATIGPGTVVSAGAIINARAVIGQHCIINSGAIIEHHTKIGDFSHIAPGSVLCGHVIIGQNCLIGAGTTIIPKISIADNVTIGAGSTVIQNITEAGTYIGSPINRRLVTIDKTDT